jgi:hypothetical protein
VAQVFKIGSRAFQIMAGAKYWADAPADGPTGWGLRLQLDLLLPE